MKRNLIAAVICLISYQANAYCQTDSTVIKNAVSKLKTLLTEHEAEKAYLHFDRPYPYYTAGDVMYFKAYVIMGERHELSKISGMLHVELIGKNNAILQTVMLQLNNGTGWGDFALPDTLQRGSYRVRAYTEWMRNEKHPNFFEQYISVSAINSTGRPAEEAKVNAKPVLQFFPEGGNMVADVRSKVAFKAVGTNGLGMDVKGTVTDGQDQEVAKIASAHLGMGTFSFLPDAGKRYKANVTFADGSKATVELPAVAEKGITLAVNTDDPSKVSIEIKANRAYYKENQNKQLNLLIYWAGAIRTINTKLDNQVLGLDLPAANFRTGVLQVTLLSQSGEPLNERMVFIQNPDQLSLTVNANKTTFGKREAVQLNLTARNAQGNPAAGYFSLSVVDESKILVDESSETTIQSYLLLSSEVKGYVEKPNYYFANLTKETRTALDALMLTQGYRRFVWKELLNDNTNTAAVYKPEQHLDIAGTVLTKAGAPIVDTKITLLADMGGQVLTASTDAQGRFVFPDVTFQTGTRFIAKMTSSAGKNAAVLTLDKPSSGAPVDMADPVASIYNANADILASYQSGQSGQATASNVALTGDKVIGPRRNDNYRSSSLTGPGHADQVIHGNEIRNSPNLSTALNGRLRDVDFVGGVPVLKNSQTLAPVSYDKDGNKIGGGAIGNSMMIIIDGTLSSGSIDNLSPSTVETVEVLKGSNAAIYGLNANNGVMVITTRQGGDDQYEASKQMSPGVFSIQPIGYYKAREFFSPAYDAGVASVKADLRTTVFWKPDIITDASGNASFNYFNADGIGSYKVIVEGIDGAGNLGHQVFTYKVE